MCVCDSALCSLVSVFCVHRRWSRCNCAPHLLPRPFKVQAVETSRRAAVEMTTAEVKSVRKRKRRKTEWGNASDGDIKWAKSLSESQLDLMVSVKQLAMERVRSTREKSLNGLLTSAGLRAIGIILEEFMLDRVETLRNAPTDPSSVIDDLRAFIGKSEDETNEINLENTAIETEEGS